MEILVSYKFTMRFIHVLTGQCNTSLLWQTAQVTTTVNMHVGSPLTYIGKIMRYVHAWFSFLINSAKGCLVLLNSELINKKDYPIIRTVLSGCVLVGVFC